MTTVRKAVFPVAALGRRFLPATKTSPKEMMPVVDKPLIQYAVEEAVAAGIRELVFVTARGKRTIEDHFDKAFELEHELEVRNKLETLDVVRNLLPRDIHCIYVRQPEALGLGDAVRCARPVIGDEPFAVLLADDLMAADPPVMRQMVERFAARGQSLIGVADVPGSEMDRHGIVHCAAERDADGLAPVAALVEKPGPGPAPSALAVVGRYILTPRIFAHLERLAPGASGEIELTDAIAALLDDEPVLAYRFAGRRFDCGSKLGYLQASVEFGRRHPEIGVAFDRFLKEEKDRKSP